MLDPMADSLPLLLRAARGEPVERTPVWMMRQAGRYMKTYRDLRDRYPSFRERSENPDLSYEISMQPYEAFRPRRGDPVFGHPHAPAGDGHRVRHC